MLTNWSLSGPDDNGHIWMNFDHPNGDKAAYNLGPEDEAFGKFADYMGQRDFGELPSVHG